MFDIRADFGLYLGIATYEVLMGLGYNQLTAGLERRGYMEGFTSLLVSGGVALTLAPFVIFNLPVIATVGGFVCSGLPMIIGSISRYLKARDIARKEMANLNGNEPKSLAK